MDFRPFHLASHLKETSGFICPGAQRMNSLSINRTLYFLFLSSAYIVLYGTTWLDMERVWRSSATYNHCYLILPISIWFMLHKRNDVTQNFRYSQQLLWLPAAFILAMILVWLLAFAADIALFMHIAAVLSLPAIFWLTFGTASAKKHRFALFYLIFLIPFGEELSLQLQNITADITVFMLQIAAVPVFRQGLYLSTPVGMFEVAEACSGLRFLIASLAVSVLFAYLNYKRLPKQIIFILFMTVLSVFANGIRAFLLVYIGEKSNMQLGFGADHYLYGWIFFGLVLLGGFWLGARFADDDINFTKTPLQLSVLPLKLPQICLVSLFVITAAFSLSLSIVTPPTTPTAALTSLANTEASNSDWGIAYFDSLAFSYLQDQHNVEYARAVYALKQTSGELFAWENQLFDKKTWVIKQRELKPNYTLLHLNSLDGNYRSILYWYQVNEQHFTQQLPTRIRQTLTYYFDSDATTSINAISVSGLAPAEAIPKITAAIDNLAKMRPKTPIAARDDMNE
jgi:exosortase A